MKVSQYFEDWELLSSLLINSIQKKNVPTGWYIKKEYTNALDDIRSYFNKPTIINVNKTMSIKYGIPEMYCRGITSDTENTKIGRTLTTQHRFGAFDITIIGISPIEVTKYIETISDKYGIKGIGTSVKENFTHMDFRNSELIKWTYAQ
jgi:hypothetical protein